MARNNVLKPVAKCATSAASKMPAAYCHCAEIASSTSTAVSVRSNADVRCSIDSDSSSIPQKSILPPISPRRILAFPGCSIRRGCTRLNMTWNSGEWLPSRFGRKRATSSGNG